MPKIDAKGRITTKETTKANKLDVNKSKAKQFPKVVIGGEKRPIIYPEPAVALYRGSTSITEEQGKAWLGWEEEGKEKFKNEFLFRDENGKKIRCTNNITNRPLYFNMVVLTIKQEILRKRWRFNGETIIIGLTALILNGQHQLIALVLAVQEWRKDPSKWPDWETEPTLEKAVAFGVSEDDLTVNTMDTCKPRSLPDVIFRSVLFNDYKGKDRKNIAHIGDFGIRCLWYRTGAKSNAYAPIRTHAESLDFIHRHPKLLEAVKHIFESDDKTGKVAWFIKPGMAAGLLYLMGSGATDRTTYYSNSDPDESMLDMSLWGKAMDFWELVSAGSEDMVPLVNKLTELHAANMATISVRAALMIKAWLLYSQGEAITIDDLDLQFDEDANGYMSLSELPTCGGIDLGRPQESGDPEPEVKPVAVKPKPTKPTKKRVDPEIENGNTVYVSEDGGYWAGELVSTSEDGQTAKIRNRLGKSFDVPMDVVSSSEPL